jgi:hypothetical protein
MSQVKFAGQSIGPSGVRPVVADKANLFECEHASQDLSSTVNNHRLAGLL